MLTFINMYVLNDTLFKAKSVIKSKCYNTDLNYYASFYIHVSHRNSMPSYSKNRMQM